MRFFNTQLGQNLTPIFDQYLRRAALPTLELAFNETEGTVAYRWKADERGVRHADPRRRAAAAGRSSSRRPTGQTMKTPLTKDEFEVATDLYYVNVTKQ